MAYFEGKDKALNKYPTEVWLYSDDFCRRKFTFAKAVFQEAARGREAAEEVDVVIFEKIVSPFRFGF